jgi:hypothetical protein
MTSKSKSFISILALAASVSVNAADLMIVEGTSQHGPEDGVPPISKAELIARAQVVALNQLDNAANYERVSEWKTKIECEPIFATSDLCYKGRAVAKASFVHKDSRNETWEVKVFVTAHGHTSEPSKWSFLQGEAAKEAEFLCGERMVSSPFFTDEHLSTGSPEATCQSYAMTAHFRCEKL